MTSQTTLSTNRTNHKIPIWIFDVLLILVILAGGYLRTAGLYWGEYQYLHPDERFLIWVGTDISPVKIEDTDAGPIKKWMTVSEYFDTPNSPLNPNNRGHGFYVYGTLPMFITRFAVEWIFGHSGFDVMTQAGRALSAIADLLSVLMVYLIASRIYDRRVGLLAAAFSSAAVLQIQQSHFFTMDTFSNLFAFLAFYFAVRIMTDQRPWPSEIKDIQLELPSNPPGWSAAKAELTKLFSHPLLWPGILFGIFYGLAMASKLSIYPLAFILPVAVAIRISVTPRNHWSNMARQAIIYLVLAGLLSLVVFRLTQPYAFSGPGVLGITPNPSWLSQIREQRNQATVEVDMPPAMQWARRPIWFSGQNLVIWGLGLPLGLLAVAAFIWAGWKMIMGDWRRHLLIWGWTAVYFAWQSSALNPTMRYQLPIYPTLAILAGWFLVELWDTGKSKISPQMKGGRFHWQQITAAALGIIVVVLTFSYAYGFAKIYLRPITRVEASHWIFQNIPGAINLQIRSPQGDFNQPLPFPYAGSITPGVPYQTGFSAQASGELKKIYFPHVASLTSRSLGANLVATLLSADGQPLTVAVQPIALGAADEQKNQKLSITVDPPIHVEKGSSYNLRLEIPGEPATSWITNRTTFRYLDENGIPIDQPIFSFMDPSSKLQASEALFSPDSSGVLTQIHLPAEPAVVSSGQPVRLIFTLTSINNTAGSEPQIINGQPSPPDDPRGPGFIFDLLEPVYLAQGDSARMTLSLNTDQPALSLAGSGIANEGEWDDGLPLRVDGYDGFGGIYPLDLNFNMYWDDTPDKLERFSRILNNSDYIVITSNRQWGSLPRIPERFPMTTVYYRHLLGCPPEKDIVWCYRVAQPGKFTGGLGFNLIKVFQSDPSIGPIDLNDQFAEEAFTVYDHPKVLIFQKQADYDPQKVRDLLGSVDFSKVIRLPPLKFDSFPGDLTLPIERWLEQQNGGTWAKLFNTDALQNKSQVVGVLLWYTTLFLLGLIAYPCVRLALPGLADRGYPLARTAGLLVLAYLAWLAGSFEVPFTQRTLVILLIALAVIGFLLFYYQKRELRQEWHSKKWYFISIEAIFLGFFLLDLLIRFGNPDLWHPWKGGEKPMDFAYLNAVLKSTSFPPYDPWYAGGYLNYYYFGFVFSGVLAKMLGIVPAVAYNLILPTMFAMIGMGAFSIAWNIYAGAPASKQAPDPNRGRQLESENGPDLENNIQPVESNDSFQVSPYWAGMAGAIGMAVLGNLGTVKMIYQGYQRLAAPGGILDGSSLISRLLWAGQGFIKNLSGTPLPYGIGDWYWNPSRAIPAIGEVEPITEFPFFTVLYGDPHAHLFSLPIALLAVGFALSVILARGRWKGILGGIFGFFLGALAVGSLKPTNTWDFYPYLALGAIALGYALVRYSEPLSNPPRRLGWTARLPDIAQRLIIAVLGIALFVGTSYLLFQPFSKWYGLGYTKIDFWQGLRTPLSAYVWHWGLFLFIIGSWLAWETREWLANTPISSVKKLQPYKSIILGAFVVLVLLAAALAFKLPVPGKSPFGNGIVVAWLALPMAAWAGVLILRPGQSDAKRFALFLIGTGLTLTLIVEAIVLVGDIGRMNTVFKFYLQVWTLFAVSAAAATGWLVSSLPRWSPGWRNTWSVAFILLVSGAVLYPVTASRAKIEDRMAPEAPKTLDGMKFMEFALYDWEGLMDLSQDYRAIRWMQENVAGSPVIVEANLRDLYRWGSRFSIYTGLPGVIGWEWHQQQQRALNPGSWVSDRIAEVDDFYTTTDLNATKAFLNKYSVKYIILGQLERNHYPGPGLDKFDNQNNILWKDVYRDGNTVIYEVLNQSDNGSG